jgi:hypothetical protein
VLDARFRSIEPQVLAGRDRHGKGRFAAIIPSSSFGASSEVPRRVVILVDRSGSMQGEAISQARKAIEACLGVLSEKDSFGLVAFDNDVVAFHPALVGGTRELRNQAHQFLMKLDARGGTELAKGFLEAARMLEGGDGDILILTDGQVSGTEKILADARPAGIRLHCLGIGSASQDRFLALLARETGGISRFVTPRERVDLSAVDLFASIGRPVASGLKAGGNIQPEAPSFVFSGTPVLLFGEVSQEGEDQIGLTWDGGQLKLPVHFSQNEAGETVWLLQGSRLITDWESRYPSAEVLAPAEKRKQSRVATRLVALSQTYGLASREMSLVAVVTRQGDRAGELPETRVVRVGMPQDTAFGAYFLSRTIGGATPSRFLGVASNRRPESIEFAMALPEAAPLSHLRSLSFGGIEPKDASADTARLGDAAEDILLALASRMDSDGGMPGKNHESRASATVIALLAFLSQGHTLTRGAFRSHVARLVSFLKSVTGLSSHQQRIVAAIIELAQKGTAPTGEWIALAHTTGNHWKEVERVVLTS